MTDATQRAVHVAIVTDGDRAQLAGAFLVLSRLLHARTGLVPHLIVARSSVNRIRRRTREFFRRVTVEIHPAAIRSDDRYFIKLGLADLVSELAPDDQLIYLDYDHVVFHPAKLLRDLGEVRDVRVSSERSQQASSAAAGPLAESAANTSLIAGPVQKLLRVTRLWHAAYVDCLAVDPRFREECAFTLAARRGRVALRRCEPGTQANWRHPVRASHCFHYGGTDVRSAAVKRRLASAPLTWAGLRQLEEVLEHDVRQAVALGTQTRRLHLGLIPDGGRRWARRHGRSLVYSYERSFRRIVRLVSVAATFGFDELSVYVLSRANLSRRSEELSAVYDAARVLLDGLSTLKATGRCDIALAGNLSALPVDVRRRLRALTASPVLTPRMRVNLLVAYDAWEEVARSLPRRTGGRLWVPRAVDSIIRTGGGHLLSGFLPMQSQYAHLIVTRKTFNAMTATEWSRILRRAASVVHRLGR